MVTHTIKYRNEKGEAKDKCKSGKIYREETSLALLTLLSETEQVTTRGRLALFLGWRYGSERPSGAWPSIEWVQSLENFSKI